MIRVNLLPAEYRKVDGTPVARFVAVIAGVFITATAMSVWGYVHFGMLSEVKVRRAQMEEELVQYQALASRSQSLLAEFKEYQRRRETIEQIAKGRILWSKKLDEWADLLHNKGDRERHLVWLASIRSEAPTGPGSGGAMAVDGWSGWEELARLSDFRQDVMDSEFFQDFHSIDPPRGERVTFRDENSPAAAWKFNARMALKEPGWREKK